MSKKMNFLTTVCKGWMPLLAMTLLAWTASQQDAAATPIFDDFDSDTSANYTQSGYQGTSPGTTYTFDSPSSELSASGNAFGSEKLVHNSASLDVGETLELVVAGIGQSGERAGLLLSDTAAFGVSGSPDNHYHMWINSNGDGTAYVRLFQRGSTVSELFNGVGSPFTAPTTASPVTLRIDRTDTDDYEFYVNNSLIASAVDSFAANLIGIEHYEQGAGGGATGSSFGSIGITAIPEPSSLALLALGMFGLACGRRGRLNG